MLLYLVSIFIFVISGIVALFALFLFKELASSKGIKEGLPFLGLVLLCLVICIPAFYGGKTLWSYEWNKSAPKGAEVTSNLVLPGYDAILVMNIFAGTTKDYQSQIDKFVVAKNSDAIDRMISAGEAVILEKGTRVTVMNNSFMSYSEVQVADGSFKGLTVYVDPKMLQKK